MRMKPSYSFRHCISPQYYEIYKHREVIGISILFMIIDLLGGLFSDLSLVFRPNFDVIAGVAYSLVVARTRSMMLHDSRLSNLFVLSRFLMLL